MILIHPFAKLLRNGQRNPKTYPWWRELINLMGKESVVQLGLEGEARLVSDFRKNLALKEIRGLLKECRLWVSIDSFLPHLAHHVRKPGVVIWSVSDPNIFGYPENLNLLRDRKYLRKNQFGIWEAESFNPNSFMKAEEIFEHLRQARSQ